MPQMSQEEANRLMDLWYDKEFKKQKDEGENREFDRELERGDGRDLDGQHYAENRDEIARLTKEQADILKKLKKGHAFGLK